MAKKNSAFSVYAVAGQTAFIIVTPLLVFIGGGSKLVDYFGWAQWLKIVFVLLGITVMMSSALAFFRKLMRLYGGQNEVKRELLPNKKDYDYTDDNYRAVKSPPDKEKP